jgi:ComF family protein
MFDSLLDFLFPRRSLTGAEGEWITREERAKLVAEPVILEEADLRKLGLQHIDRIVAASAYRQSPLLRKAIHTFKYGKVFDLQHELGGALASACELLVLHDAPALCPVPLHWSRLFARGFNQSSLLARAVARRRTLPFRELLRRVRPTGHQVGRGREERLTNVRDAFAVRRGRIVPRSVILVDDLSTTGATLDNCAKALKRAGARSVQGLVVAHG